MAPSTPRLRVLSVGGNPLSAFLSWRLQATLSCDVTLVWKTTYESVSQYGISFKSTKFGNERFKPHSVVRTPEEAGTLAGGYDYVLLSVKALPDVYDIASIIESVVTPQHTCILVNTTTALGTEAYLESRYPTNVVLSLVSGVTLNQLGTSEFEHTGNADIWVGSAITNANVPHAIQLDMAEALALTLASGDVECHVSENIRQQQWDRTLGLISFHPLSVIMETSNLAALLEKPSCKQLVNDLIDELLAIARAQGCVFPDDIKQRTIEEQTKASPSTNIMHQDYAARRPLEIEIFLGSPIKIARSLNIPAPHLNTLYPILHHLNQQNQNRPPPSPPGSVNPSPRSVQGPPMHHGPGMGPGSRPPSGMPPRRPPPAGGRGGMDPRAQRGPPRAGPPNGYAPNGNGAYPRAPSNQVSRRNSLDDDLGEEFGHIALYGDMPDIGDGAGPAPPHQLNGGIPTQAEVALRERELALRERELMLRQQEMMANGGGGGPRRGGRRPMQAPRSKSVYDDDEDEDYYDPNPPPMPVADVDNLDMMSVTSRRNRRLPSASNVRNNPEGSMSAPGRGRHSLFGRSRNGSSGNRQSASARLLNDVPTMGDPLQDNLLAGYSSNRYGAVDRKNIVDNSRANSMSSQMDIRDNPAFSSTAGGAYPAMNTGRRMSNSPGDGKRPDFQPQRSGYGQDPRALRGPPPDGYRPSTNGGFPNSHGPPDGYRPSTNGGFPNGNGPPDGYRPQTNGGYPNGNGQPLPPHQVEQHVSDGVRHPHNLKGPPSNNVRSTTGNGNAPSINTDSGPSTGGQNSAYSSSSSLGKRVPSAGVAVR